MPAKKLSTVPDKDDVIISPKTGRPIKVGGSVWKKLVREGLLEGHYKNSHVLEESYDEMSANDMKMHLHNINKKLPKDTIAVRGRGMYKGKIVKRSRQIPAADMTKITAKVASRVMSNNIDALCEAEDMEAAFEQMIMNEMVQARPKPKPVGRPRRRKAVEEDQYDIESVADPESSDESESE